MERIPTIVDSSWHKYLQKLFDDPKMNLIRDKLLPSCKFFPEGKNIFRVFSMPIDKIKVVILGQDPYINEGEAIGFAFAVSRHKPAPKSLQIIKQEIINEKVERDLSVNIESDIWKELVHWKNQGVFLLNSALTVEFKNSGSHLGQWEWFTREVIRIISEEMAPVWILWGSPAKSNKAFISKPVVVKTPEDLVTDGKLINYIIEGNHPAVEAYTDSKYKFYGCNHFKMCNGILKHKHKTIINW